MKNRIAQFTLLFFLFSAVSFAQEKAIFQKNGIAINGHDAVAYFTDSKAVEGSESFVFEWMGAKWLFSSSEHLEAFKANPEKYAPQFGGYCAYGVSENHKSPTDPNAWTIVDQKLYLNYSKKVKELWSKDVPTRIQKANEYWPTLNKSN
ncbi:YHS domain-containing protein [Runella defluvii]|uniref:YHS domain-containing protein n=1 Tax=Runella defluvii TaxID=370973 RepID=A0A7W6ERN8_9BACT|nr:YHS domain-containing (seleno)protein [Runella defluvii]MBB3839687.1 YHS domain-containing protein [Runella defluvii]